MAPRGQVCQIWRLARDGVEGLLATELWYCSEQGLGIGMPGIREELSHRTVFDDLARIHDRHFVAHLGDDPQIVGDEDQRHAGVPLQVFEEVQILRLDGHIQVGGGLVGDDQFGAARQGNSADDALPHTATHLMRILAHARRGGRNADGSQ